MYDKNNAYHGESMLDFCIRIVWSRGIWEMLVCDFLILNRDRHGVENRRIQSFIGGGSALENLKLILRDEMPKLSGLKGQDREALSAGLDVAIDKAWLDKIWAMLIEKMIFAVRDASGICKTRSCGSSIPLQARHSSLNFPDDAEPLNIPMPLDSYYWKGTRTLKDVVHTITTT